jgi:hypothetical protein
MYSAAASASAHDSLQGRPGNTVKNRKAATGPVAQQQMNSAAASASAHDSLQGRPASRALQRKQSTAVQRNAEACSLAQQQVHSTAAST